MNVWKHLSALDLTALWALALLCVRHPWWVLPTIRATRECVAVCNLHYGTQHHRNTAANAFRHALWNYYVARACYRGKANIMHVLKWTEKFTSWHEDFSKNPPIARQMDLHNNNAGRVLFEKEPHLKTEEVIDIFKLKAEASVKIIEKEDMATIGRNCFVHLKD